eukprot:3955504-Amphidinium_carterae.1
MPRGSVPMSSGHTKRRLRPKTELQSGGCEVSKHVCLLRSTVSVVYLCLAVAPIFPCYMNRPTLKSFKTKG